jgi:hypothetical protein
MICGVTESCARAAALALAHVTMCVFINTGDLVRTLPRLLFQSLRKTNWVK